MAVDVVADSERLGLRLPNPPPLLHTRGESFDRPSTPAEHGFTSPTQTPQGSPSKSRPPPGSLDLPNVFDKALKLTPTSPNKSTHNYLHHPMFTPDKSQPETFTESVIHQRPSSPSRSSKANKENTPPTSTRLPKDLGSKPTAAAISRHEPYQQREADTSKRQVQLRGLTPEELEKLQQPRVKRLVNVTQLCKWHPPEEARDQGGRSQTRSKRWGGRGFIERCGTLFFAPLFAHIKFSDDQTSSTTTLIFSVTSIIGKPDTPNSKLRTPSPPRRPTRNMNPLC